MFLGDIGLFPDFTGQEVLCGGGLVWPSSRPDQKQILHQEAPWTQPILERRGVCLQASTCN